MRKILLAKLVLVMAMVGPAMATPASVGFKATVAQDCQINTGTSSSIDLTGTDVNEAVEGDFEYQCNFIGPHIPLLRVKSLHGGVKNGSHVAQYGIFLNDLTPGDANLPLPTDWTQSGDADTGSGAPLSGAVEATAANVPQFPHFLVGLTEPLTVAGYYHDVLTITIIP